VKGFSLLSLSSWPKKESKEEEEEEGGVDDLF
jgi:hypothetical protein